MPTGIVRRRFVIGAVLLSWLISEPGCITCSMWSSVDKKTSHRIEAGLATPVTLALDAAIIGGCICVLALAQAGPSTMMDVAPSNPTTRSFSCR